MNTINPKTVAIVQTLFYGAVTAFLPVLIGMLTSGSIVIPWGLTGVVLVVLNYYDNKLSAQKGGAFFGAIA